MRARAAQPIGGLSSSSLCCPERRQPPCKQNQLTPRSTTKIKERLLRQSQHSSRQSQPTPRRNHEVDATAAFEVSCDGNAQLSYRAWAHAQQPPSHRHDRMERSQQLRQGHVERQGSTRDGALRTCTPKTAREPLYSWEEASAPVLSARSHESRYRSMPIGWEDASAPVLGTRAPEIKDRRVPMCREDASAPGLSAYAPEPKHRSLHTQRRMEQRKMDPPFAQSTCRSSPHFGPSPQCTAPSNRRHASLGTGHADPPGSARRQVAEPPSSARRHCEDGVHYFGADRRRNQGMETFPRRTLPGEELHAPVCNSWINPSGRVDELTHSTSQLSGQRQFEPARRTSNELAEPRPRRGTADPSARCCPQRPHKNSALPAKSPVNSSRNAVLGLGPHPWSMGSSIATSAQGSVIDSCPDLWETSSVDSLPLGAEWFNFMHKHV